jgi:hypothetical protein
MMHEQIHAHAHAQAEPNPETEQQQEQPEILSRSKAEEVIRQVSAAMRAAALAAPTFTHHENERAVMSGKFSAYLPLTSGFGIYAVFTISPSNDETEIFWHCSMSLVNPRSHRAKTFQLWTKRERQMVKNLLRKFLDGAGNKTDEHFLQTKTALHLSRGLTGAELEQAAENRQKFLENSEEGAGENGGDNQSDA